MVGTGEVIQQLFPTEPATYGLGSTKGEPYWNVVALMEIVGETNKSCHTVAMFLGHFEALAPLSTSKIAFSQADKLVYERSIKRMGDGGKVTDFLREEIDHLKEEDLPSLFINRSWAERILRAKAEGGISAMRVEVRSFFGVRSHHASVQRADGHSFDM